MYFYALQTEWLIHPTSFLNAVQKRAEWTQGFYPSWKREAAWKSQLVAFSWWLFASCSAPQSQAYRRYVSIQQNMKTPQISERPYVPMTWAPQRWAKPLSACFAYPCNVLKAFPKVRLYSSGVFCLGQYFQQLIVRKEVEPENKDWAVEEILFNTASRMESWQEEEQAPFLTAHWSLCICVEVPAMV